MTTLFGSMGHAWKSAVNNKRWFLLSVIFDITFFGVFFVVFSAIQMKILEHILVLYQMTSSIGQAGSASELAAAVLRQPEFILHTAELMRWLAILMVAVYLIWGLLQGVVWMCSIKVSDRKWRHSFGFLGKFFAVNLVWISLFYSFLYTWVKLSVYASFNVLSGLGQDLATGLFVSASLALAYFALVSYPLLKTTSVNKILQKTLLLSIVKWKRFLPMFAVLIGSLIFLAIAFFFVIQAGFVGFLAFTVLIALPLLALLRIFVVISVEGV